MDRRRTKDRGGAASGAGGAGAESRFPRLGGGQRAPSANDNRHGPGLRYRHLWRSGAFKLIAAIVGAGAITYWLM
ncbi:MAG: hypothetical protein HYR63_13385 [Proteobacteria bacterium]|nr:hypothetical protein [Pseudomonadota bacterium]MBI3496910.1 hypothetical protein [Pseudomonadota bacterium]